MKQLLTLLFIGLTSLYAQTVPSYVPTNGLVGWWPFNGNANDESGNGNSGSYVTGVNPTSDRNGMSNSAMGFNGQGSISLSALPTSGSQNFTITGWILTSNASSVRKGIACWGQDQPWQSTYFFVNTNGKLAFDFAYGAGPISTALVNDAQWHFVSVTNTNGLIQLYVDGVPNGQGMQLSLPNISGNTKSIGSNLSGGGTQNNFAGKLDDLAIWNRALTSTEIQNIYNQINTNTSLPTYVPANGLVGWWPFNGNANDESGNGNNGSVNGASLTFDRTGNNGCAYDFDGVNDAIDISNSLFNNGWNEYSISLWFKIQATTQTGASQCFINTNPHDGWAIGYNHSNIQPNRIAHAKNANPNFHLWDVIHPNNAAISGPILDTSRWINLTIVKSDSVYDYYINGVLDTTKYISNSSSIINYWCQLRIGNIALPYNNEPFNGKIDDIGIWNRALTPTEIQGLSVVNGIGLGESTLDNLTISPNPTNGVVSMNISVVGNYELLTLDGRVLESGTAKRDYDLTKYPKGVYHLRLSTDEGTRVLKVVKN